MLEEPSALRNTLKGGDDIWLPLFLDSFIYSTLLLSDYLPSSVERGMIVSMVVLVMTISMAVKV
jgi:hypothetical protein